MRPPSAAQELSPEDDALRSISQIKKCGLRPHSGYCSTTTGTSTGLVHLPSRCDTESGVTLPATCPSNTTAGARPQEPTQRAVSSDTLPSEVVSPALMPTVSPTVSINRCAPLM